MPNINKESPDWKPISSAPKDGTEIIGYWHNGEINVGCIDNDEWIPSWDQEEKWSMPTHWMPLPNRPRKP